MSESAPTPRRERVIVGMSGGVDSSVSALLLLQQGYQVEGLFMKNWDEDDGTEYCTAREDLADAQAVCDRIGIKLHTANFAAEYWDNVFEHFLAEYKAGRTPNPDILCNREIKFKAFLDYALMLGADLIATGHYVRRRDRDGRTELLKGLDPNKDQSYFLHAVGGEQIARSLFPVGELEKPEVRAIAEKHGLATAKKKDSTGICFIGERRFTDFLKQYLPAQPGDIETTEGKVIGRHSGLMYHTIGQRQGLGIGGLKEAGDDPWYVLGKDLQRNVLLVGQGNDHPLLFSRALLASRIYWVNPVELERPRRLRAKVRYRQSDQDCVLEKTAEGYRAVFDEAGRPTTAQVGGWVLAHCQQRFLQDDNGLLFPREWLKRQELPLLAEHGVGHWQGEPVYVLELDEPIELPGMAWAPLRQFMLHGDFDQFCMLGYASQIGIWARHNRFCGNCGTRMQAQDHERVMQCPQCGLHQYPRLSPSMIVLVTRGDEVLLARSPRFVPGVYSTLAGFVEAGESVEQCVVREVREEVGVEVANLEYIGSQNWPFPHSLMLGFHAEYVSGEIVPQEDEIEDAQWFSLDALPPLPAQRSIARHLIDLYLARRSGAAEPVLPG